MLSRASRLSSAEVTAVLRQGERFKLPGAGLRVLPAPDSPTRLAVIVSARQVKRAVDRHRLTRRGRAALRHFLADLRPGFWAALFLQAEAARWPFRQLLERVAQLLKSAKMLI